MLSISQPLTKLMNIMLPAPDIDTAVRILLVEDDPAQQEILYHTIRHAGVIVETASTHREALYKIQDSANEIDVLILDWRLSNKDAQTVFDNWLDRHIGKPSAIVSAYVTPELRIKLLREGAHNVLDKPVDLEAFLRIIHRYVYQVKRDREISALRMEIFRLKRITVALLILGIATTITQNYSGVLDLIGAIL